MSLAVCHVVSYSSSKELREVKLRLSQLLAYPINPKASNI